MRENGVDGCINLDREYGLSWAQKLLKTTFRIWTLPAATNYEIALDMQLLKSYFCKQKSVF